MSVLLFQRTVGSPSSASTPSFAIPPSPMTEPLIRASFPGAMNNSTIHPGPMDSIPAVLSNDTDDRDIELPMAFSSIP